MAQSGDLDGSLDLLLAILVSEHLLADGAGPVSFRTVLGAGCGNRLGLGQLVGSQRQILDLSGIAVLIHNSAALAALVVGFPALFHAGRLLCGNRNGGVLVGRHLHSYRAGSSLAVGGSSDSGSALANSSNNTVGNSGNLIVAGRPGNGLVGRVVRRDSRGQRAGLAHFQIHGRGRKGNGSDVNRLSSSSNRHRRTRCYITRSIQLAIYAFIAQGKCRSSSSNSVLCLKSQSINRPRLDVKKAICEVCCSHLIISAFRIREALRGMRHFRRSTTLASFAAGQFKHFSIVINPELKRFNIFHSLIDLELKTQAVTSFNCCGFRIQRKRSFTGCKCRHSQAHCQHQCQK